LFSLKYSSLFVFFILSILSVVGWIGFVFLLPIQFIKYLLNKKKLKIKKEEKKESETKNDFKTIFSNFIKKIKIFIISIFKKVFVQIYETVLILFQPRMILLMPFFFFSGFMYIFYFSGFFIFFLNSNFLNLIIFSFTTQNWN
jgi:hypothetical protein